MAIFHTHLLSNSSWEENGCKCFRAVFLTSEPDPWPNKWYNWILQKVLFYSLLMCVTDRRTDG